MAVISKETNSSPLKREAVCGTGGASHSAIMRPKNSCKYRPGTQPRTPVEPSLLLYRYGIMRHEFGRFYAPKNTPRPLEIAFCRLSLKAGERTCFSKFGLSWVKSPAEWNMSIVNVRYTEILNPEMVASIFT
jgi:hypothetical protein